MKYNYVPKSEAELPASHREAARILWANKIPFLAEYEFDKDFGGRRWRHDLFIPGADIGIEIEGGLGRAMKSRHTTYGGAAEDCVKYAVSQGNGNVVFRTTTDFETVHRVMAQVVRLWKAREKRPG